MIARGTTPVIRVMYRVVDVSTIDVAYLTIKQGGVTIEKDIQDATVVHSGDNNYLEWSLTQEETLSLCSNCNVEMQVRCRANGEAYDSPINIAPVYRILKEGVI